ncbi:MAG: TAT-variant-translocated molybdopterin oxidoreductase [Candidatus Anammoximicrobium sp.]|nr:TAT-variant-translocated molybdopterin oxidoreductase [Candidatus Anammoximicrobium sp.]
MISETGIPAAAAARPAGRRYWRSLEEQADTAPFREPAGEFPPAAAEMFQASRRGFLKIMGASLSLAGLSGCVRYPQERLAPYAHQPDGRTPGVPVRYATAWEVAGVAQGLLITSYDGRPIKVEGNPAHPVNRGAADAQAQAAVLELYDPDRSRGAIRREGVERTPVAWDDFFRWVKQELAGDGTGVAILSEASSSPSVADLRARLQKAMPKLEWFEYEPLSEDNVREGVRRAFGRGLRTVPDLASARVVVSLDADLFGGGHPLAIKHARDFAAGRQSGGAAGEAPNRLYVVESIHSMTGACADHRRAVRASAVGVVAARLAARLGVVGAVEPETNPDGVEAAFFEAVQKDLEAAAGRSLIVAGARQPPEVHALVAAINDKLGNTGRTVLYYDDPDSGRPAHAEALRTLVRKIDEGAVAKLLILGGNPVYNAPADIAFAEALRKVQSHAVHLALHEDETSLLCRWHLSRAHALEAWGDALAYDGTYTIVQPLIEPLFDGKSVLEILAALAGETVDAGGGYELVRRTFRGWVGESFSEWKWKKTLADGVLERDAGTAGAPVDVGGQARPPEGVLPQGEDSFEVVFFADGKMHDGRFANNGWLQELPEPMTRLTWDNAALMSPATAEQVGLQRDELVSLQAGDSAGLLAPAYLLPGMPDGVIGLALGYGRTAAGNVGSGVGQNAYALRTTAGLGWRSGVSVQGTGRMHPLATVQDHHIVDAVGRAAVQERIPELIREGTFAELAADPALGQEKTRRLSPFNEHRFDGGAAGRADQSHVPAHDRHRWGLAVDLTACTGCGACVLACQAENNIPIVGREQVLHGREMHWIRVDRYFRETPESPVAVHQPVMCMHCENAPCEAVCPVAATTHSQEGLNMMTYNRCVGTRYCANNCPYKVRRFNYFDFNRGTLHDLYEPNLIREPVSELVKMQKNPEVTVRMRGVMEKCTFCVQRIENARAAAGREGGRPLADGEIQTACQQTCPARAIVFGDLNDPRSRVSQLQQQAHSYGMLDDDFNTKPRTRYLAKLRNPAVGLDEVLSWRAENT